MISDVGKPQNTPCPMAHRLFKEVLQKTALQARPHGFRGGLRTQSSPSSSSSSLVAG